MRKAKKTSSAKTRTRKTKTLAASKKTEHAPKAHATSSTVVMDRRGTGDRRASEDRRKAEIPVATERRSLERRQKISRRRQIDPTTCERNYSAEEIEFMTALEGYKRTSGRMFPTCSEILEVLRGLGYERPLKASGAAEAGSAAALTSSVDSVPQVPASSL